NIVAGAANVAKGALQVALPFVDVDKILAKIKEIIVGLLEKVGKGVLNSGLGGIFEKILGMVAPDMKGAIDTIKSVAEPGRELPDVINNPDEYLQKGRQWAIDKLTDLAMKVFQPPLEKLVGAITGFGMKLLKHLITSPLAVAVSGAIASFTFGLGAVL